MSYLLKTLVFVCFVLGLSACASNQHRLGMYTAELRAEQTFNPNATQENIGYIPTGSGERMEGAYQIYTGKQSKDLSGTDSQFLEGFTE